MGQGHTLSPGPRVQDPAHPHPAMRLAPLRTGAVPLRNNSVLGATLGCWVLMLLGQILPVDASNDQPVPTEGTRLLL